MELLLLLLLSPSVILCQRYRSGATSSSNPNDEPFLPIYPIYPYSPKLMKRGAETELTAPLTAELYSPKTDTRDSFTSSFAGNYQRDPYFPSYNPYPKTSTSSFPAGSSVSAAVFNPGSFATPSSYGTSSGAYNRNNYAAPASYSPYTTGYSVLYPYTPAPYGMYNSYGYTQPPNAYPTSPYGAGSYSNYNYQPPYYYPGYYNQPYPPIPPPPPPPPHGTQDYSGSAGDESSADDDQDQKTSPKKSDSKKSRYKDDESENNEGKDEQFVDGVNYLSSANKDLDGQSTSYKTPYNQLDQLSDLHIRNIPIPGLSRTTYRVISVGGQPVGPDYPLPPNYAKVQQLEQIMGQTLAKLLAQNHPGQAHSGQANSQYRINEPSGDLPAYGGATGYVNKSPTGVIAKTGLAYVVNPTNLPKTGNRGQFGDNYGNPRIPVIIKVPDPNHVLQSSTVLAKARFPQKSVTAVSLQQAPGVYIPPEAKNIKDDNSQPPEYSDYDSNPSQNYDDSNGSYKKTDQNYPIDQNGQTAPYQNSNLVTVQTPQTYQYSSYLPTQPSQQPRDYKTSLDEVNFGTKRNAKA